MPQEIAVIIRKIAKITRQGEILRPIRQLLFRTRFPANGEVVISSSHARSAETSRAGSPLERILPYRKCRAAVKRTGIPWTILFLVLFPVPAAASAGDVDLEKEAKRPFVNKIELIGNEHFSDKELKEKMYTTEPSFFAIFNKPRLRPSYLQRDVSFLEAFYHSQGFFEATVTLRPLQYSTERRFVDIAIEILEGEATLVEEIVFIRSTIVPAEKLMKQLILRAERPFNPSLLQTDIYAIKNEYSKKGYPAAEVRDSLYFTDHRVRIYYRIDSGPKMLIRNITLKGNEMTKPGIVRQELTFKEGAVFNLDKLLESRRNLFDTGLFTEAELNPEQIDLENKTVDISVRVRERKATYIEAGFGVGNVLGTRVLGEWGDRNLFGTGRKLKLKAQVSFDLFEDGDVDINKLNLRRKFTRYDGEFHQRHLLGTKYLVGLNAFHEEDATVQPITITTFGASVIANRRISQTTDLFFSLAHERIKRESPDIPADKSTSRIFSSSISKDKRDFILNPSRGSYRAFRFDVAGGILGGDNNFYSMLLSLQKYLKSGRNAVFAVRTRIGYADAFGPSSDTGVPIENRFFTGGGNSVRGYRENSLGPRGLFRDVNQPQSAEGVIGGRMLLLTNAEYRFNIPLLSRINISGAAFLDGGNVWGSLREMKLKYFRPSIQEKDVVQQDYRYSYGFGLRYNTPVGPIRLDYGIPIKRDAFTDNSGRFHISLGQIF